MAWGAIVCDIVIVYRWRSIWRRTRRGARLSLALRDLYVLIAFGFFLFEKFYCHADRDDHYPYYYILHLRKIS